MRTRLLALLAVCTFAACDAGGGDPTPTEDRQPGFKPGERLMIYMTSTRVGYDTCTNSEPWVSGAESLTSQLSPGHVAYEISADGTQADLLNCTTKNALNTCNPSSPRTILSVEEGALVLRFQERVTPPDSSCVIVYDTVATTVDNGTTFTETMLQEVSLDGAENECAALDERFRSTGSNGYGIDGCLLTFTTAGRLH